MSESLVKKSCPARPAAAGWVPSGPDRLILFQSRVSGARGRWLPACCFGVRASESLGSEARRTWVGAVSSTPVEVTRKEVGSFPVASRWAVPPGRSYPPVVRATGVAEGASIKTDPMSVVVAGIFTPAGP
jgi:hypothetical protein